jgi:hypothetical protein
VELIGEYIMTDGGVLSTMKDQFEMAELPALSTMLSIIACAPSDKDEGTRRMPDGEIIA